MSNRQTPLESFDVKDLADRSWAVHDDRLVKLYLVLGAPPSVRVEVKTRSKTRPVAKNYQPPCAATTKPC